MAVLPDLLDTSVVTVFCGSAAGAASARRGLPYAGPGNKFWPMLHETGLTPRLFTPDDYRELLAHGIGLTDVNKTQSGADSDLTPTAMMWPPSWPRSNATSRNCWPSPPSARPGCS